jgi:hypothetical protein
MPPPFVPPRPQENRVTKSQARIIIILLIGILAISAATFVLQLTQRSGLSANGRGAVTFGDGSTPPTFQQTPDESQGNSDTQ